MAGVKNIGDIAVARIEELGGPVFGPQSLIPDWNDADVAPHMKWMVPNHFDPASGNMGGVFQSWLLKTKHHTILIDTCVGNDKDRPGFTNFHRAKHPWMENLLAAGYHPNDIDIVMCTHLHVDHVGWNTKLENGRWVPTFPKARYLFAKADRDYWDPKTGGHSAMAMNEVMFNDSVLPVIESGQAQLVSGVHEIESGIEIHPAPGHTPGTIILKANSGDRRAIFAGDCMHHPIQIYHPEWGVSVDEDKDQAYKTRVNIYEECADRRSLLVPAHFAAPHACYVHREGKAYAPDFRI